MQQILVSDIFGKTPGLEKLVSELSGKFEIIDPYDGANMAFQSEAEAYVYFSKNVGLDEYTRKLSAAIASLDCHSRLLGFSVGASAIWKLSSEPYAQNVLGAILFYSSQIRHDTHLNPVFPVKLVFPKTEEHFSVEEICLILSKNKNVHIHQSEYLHGFMNAHSKNFNMAAYNTYKQVLLDFLSEST